MIRIPSHRVAGLLALGLLACEPSPIVSTGLALTLEGCIEPGEAPESCRARLQAVAPVEAAACLVVVPAGDGARIARIPFVWQGMRLVPAERGAAVEFSVDEGLEASLFVLAADAGGCDDFTLRDGCLGGEGCIARYGPVGRAPNPSGVTALDFVRGGACLVEFAPQHQILFPEICGDAIDNDCDGRSDEDLFSVCVVGVGACAATGERQICRGDSYTCDALPGYPEADVTCDDIDDDCDGIVDEGGDCNRCLFDNECLGTPETSQCVEGRCEGCDPTTGDGCDATAPICDPGSATCRTCRGDAECDPGRVCAFGRCQACDPTRPDAGCVDPAEPTCDAEDFVCRPCRDGSECISGICFNGRCGVCDPVTHAGCVAPNLFCDTNNLTCRACNLDSECARVDPRLPVCLAGECVECDPANNVGCGDPNRPICARDPIEAPPSCGPCEDSGECAPLQCRNGRCVGCDPVDNSGCDPLGGQPICDADGPDGDAVCSPCTLDPQCPAGLGRGVCNGGRCTECSDDDARGCPEDSGEPICDGGQCRVCAGDGECALRPGDRNLCVENRCQLCDPDSNRGCGGDTPVCGGAGCRRCGADAECGGRQCVGGRCQVCDPANNDGCPAEAPICGAGGAACEACDPEAADTGCDPGSDSPVCDPQTLRCVTCVADAECADNPEGIVCRDGACGCTPGDNGTCPNDMFQPVCSNALQTCRACINHGECPAGQRCRGGACEP